MNQKNNWVVVQSDKSRFVQAGLVKYSISKYQNEIKTFELEYPRYIHAEIMTHRIFSRNAASSRAIPTHKKISMIWRDPVIPIKWGKNKAGMQDEGELSNVKKGICRFAWKTLSKFACIAAWSMSKVGLHKQYVNRVLEPWERYKAIITCTESDNFFDLRLHKDAQPEIQELAYCMKEALNLSKPELLHPGEWHLPYVDSRRSETTRKLEYFMNGEEVSLEDAKQISVSCCAQVSYRMLDDSLEKALRIYNRLITSKPSHWSPTEHQATPMHYPVVCFENEVEPGMTHMQLDTSEAWSGNFKGWIQNRQLLQIESGDLPMTVK